ncbi:M23 family metallopeptidase (plasmid) [Rossellomorea sp. AcN35-11]|nr:M23 family metallopeptidase [Rossellomorea aquimaris]WJV32113.1 M23 family metallopeptidase [Rossellomorea sp. AcN35-11]
MKLVNSEKNGGTSGMSSEGKQTNKNLWVKSVITTSAALLMMMNTSTVSAHQDKNVIFKIYNSDNDNSIGPVENNDLIQNVIEEKKKELEERLGSDNSLTLEGKVSYVPEFVLRSGAGDKGAEEWIKDNVSIVANATKIQVDGELVGYVEDEAAAQEIIKRIKLKYVSAEEIVHLEKQFDGENNEEVSNEIDLNAGESKVYNIYVEKKLETDSGRVLPEKVLSIDEAVGILEKGPLQEKIHAVESGDFLGKVAQKYNLSSEQLIELNPGLTETSIIHIGDELNVQVVEPLIDVVIKEVVSELEEIPFKTEVIESDDLYKGETQVKQGGSNGEKMVRYNVIKKNGTQISKDVIEENLVRKPQTKIIIKGTKVETSKETDSFAWPTVGGYVSSHIGPRWGKFHKGTDIARPSNHSILAVDNGTVEFAGWDNGGYGNKIIINHKNGIKTLYAHLSSIDVSVGQRVQKGSKIGVMGTTGESTGVHLHLEVRKNGKLVDPMDFY